MISENKKLFAEIDEIENECMWPTWDGHNAELISATIALARQVAGTLTDDWEVSLMPDGSVSFDSGNLDGGVKNITVVVLKRGTWLKE